MFDESKDTKIQGAVCPYCLADPFTMNMGQAVIDIPGGKMAIGQFFCANPECRKVINIAVLGMQPTIEQPRRGLGLV